ncbi:MAG: AAA family ATPase [Nitrosomonas sp.]|nr:AAA family ATPase [Nitrosomonas sp.]MDP1951698.1 AAA family ATPase [Nitrosomonas sp.]
MSEGANNPKQTSALHEILNWSAGRPDWQRDALRRILEKGNLVDSDLLELERICRAKHQVDFSNSSAIQCVHLSQSHLPLALGAAESVSLVSVGNFENVNRLPPGQTIPLGAEIGLTVIYGENGAGKSGYARVIKKACRARGVQPIIRPNAFISANTAKASAEIVFKVGGAEVPVKWVDGVSADSRLANVFVFDASSAGHYVSEDGAAAFTPYGLDVLPTLSKVCDAIDEQFKNDIAKKRSSITGALANWKYDHVTQVGKLIHGLSATTKVADIESHSGLDATQSQRLQDLRAAFKADPLQQAKLTRAAAARLDLFAKRIASITVDLADDKIAELKKLLDDARDTDSAAKAFALGQFDSSFLTGTGADLWRTLWNAARVYSNTVAYKDQTFPVTTDESRCVLCQQELSSEAAKRLAAFEKFTKDTSQQLAANAEKLVVTANNKLVLIAALQDEMEKVDADLALLTTTQRSLLAEFVVKADERLRLIKQSFSTRSWLPSTTSLTPSPESSIRALQASLEARAKMEESAHNPETLKKLIAEGAELGAREWLSGVKIDVLAQIEAYKSIAKLELCRKDVATAQITIKSSDLTKQFVTNAFQQRFKDELKLLGLKTLEVGLEPVKEKKGETKFGLRLVSARNQKVVDIASEGEQRCIALAAFMSELSQASHKSALVFDDPVSSLDHWHREKIADRLVAEAKHRQVIVFTHDVVFLNDLLAFAGKSVIVPDIFTLEWNDGAPGKHIKGLPWDSKKPLECLVELENNQKAISAKWNPQPNAANVEAMRHVYSRLRSTIERVVENDLLEGIVSRFKSQIHAGKVKALIGIPLDECDELKRLYQRCHDITDAHAPSQVLIPDPTELSKDLADVRQLIGAIKLRKSSAQTQESKS